MSEINETTGVQTPSEHTGARVFLVGAGPGDPGLFTLKGKECLERADVVIYDYLANSMLLKYARPEAELLSVGKIGHTHHVSQEQINALIIEKARQEGVATVVRLKGGDPFVFGRGGEEALALAQEGIAFEVVPGVTAGVAALAYAGIPVTHRGLASSVSLITGHEDPTKDESALNWHHMARGTDTLCFYMGITALPRIAERLMEHGRPASTPVALVRWGTTPAQQVLVSCLGEVTEAARQQAFKAPALIVVGEVVRLRDQIAWFERARPLLGLRVAVTRSRTQASALSSLLSGKGASVFEFPTITLAQPESFAPLDAALAELSTYDWVVFTSVNGVAAFFERLEHSGRDSRALGACKVAAIGAATAEMLRSWGIIAEVVPGEYKAEGVLAALKEAGVGVGTRVLVARAAEARDVLPVGLVEAGAQVEVVPAYRTLVERNNELAGLVQRLEAQELDVMTFTSSSTVRNCMKLLTEQVGSAEALRLLEHVQLVSIGPITTQTAENLGLTIAKQAKVYTIAGLVEAIED